MIYNMKYMVYSDMLVFIVAFAMLYAIINMSIRNSENFRIFIWALIILMVACVINSIRYPIANHWKDAPDWILYGRRGLFYVLCLTDLMFFQCYVVYLFHLEHKKERRWIISFQIVWGIGCICCIISNTPLKIGYYIVNGVSMIDKTTDLFAYFYVYDVFIIAILFWYYHTRLAIRIRNAVIWVSTFSFGIMIFQTVAGISSFTTLTYLLPMLVALLMLHSNPYDTETGALDSVSMDNLLRQGSKKLDQLSFLSLKLKEDHEVDADMWSMFYYFQEGYVKKVELYRLGYNRIIMAYHKQENEEKIRDMIDTKFMKAYEMYKIPYKILNIPDISFLTSSEDFQRFAVYFEKRMNENEVKFITEEDMEKYRESRYILSQLTDIVEKMDLDDPRVMVYCQPVQNVKTNQFDTAETLMRLKLEKMPFVTPDKFIALAESHDLVHGLSLIILSKACESVAQLLREGYSINRVSVNFSISEIHEMRFCEDVMEIIERHHIPYETIAIEITESQNDKDYEMIKRKVRILREKGMKIYLDDFGSGYSNLDRIFGINFDVIKFDRSLLQFANDTALGNTVLSYFSGMLYSLGYTLLFEGVETELQEQICKKNRANYLQGFRYSKPIPIEQLKDYLTKSVNR